MLFQYGIFFMRDRIFGLIFLNNNIFIFFGMWFGCLIKFKCDEVELLNIL